MELCKMAQEYRRNTALLELRKKQLLAAKRHAKQYEVKYRLMRRIRTLNEMINESRLAAFEMEKYYEEEFGGEKIIGMNYKEREIFMKLKIRNVGDDTLRVSRLVHQVHFEANPAGCANGIDEYYFPVEQIEPQEEAEGVISIALSRGDVDDKVYDTFIKNNTIRLVKSAYPVIKMIEFKIG